MGRKSPAFSFYPDSWIGGTNRLTPLQRAAYIDLLSNQWLEGCFDFATALLVCRGVPESDVRIVLERKFSRQDGLFYNERLEEERRKQAVKREAGSKGGSKRQANRLANGKQKSSKRVSKPSSKSLGSVSDSVSDSVSTSKHKPNGFVADATGAPTPEQVLQLWNQKMGQNCQLTEKRRVAARQRFADPFWAENWRQAIDKASLSSFCRGGGSTGWKADLEWFLKPDSVTKLIEGKYDDHFDQKKTNNRLTPAQQREANMADLYRFYEKQEGGSNEDQPQGIAGLLSVRGN